MRRVIQILLFSLLLSGATVTFGQGKQGTNTTSGNQQGGSTGITYKRNDLLTELDETNTITLCYELESTGSVGQPYILSPSLPNNSNNRECFKLGDQFEKPLVSRNKLAIKVHGLKSDFEKLESFTINVTSQQGAAINPTPLRPMMSTAAVNQGGVGAATERTDESYYLVWPFRLQGDTIPTITMTALYLPGVKWTRQTAFASGAVIVANPDNNHFYTAVQGGVSGSTAPSFPTTNNAKVLDGAVIWQESGTEGASAMQQTTASQATDENISLLNLTIPQVHALSYYSISFGIVVSSLRNPTFVRTQQTLSPNPTFTTTKDNGPLTVAPVLAFTAYILPLDAERGWRPADLIPGASVGFSLTDPANSYFFGGSSEIRRNVQIMYGLNLGKINALAPGVQVPTSSAAPATTKRFAKGGFLGLTFNFDFIKTLFGGGSKSS